MSNFQTGCINGINPATLKVTQANLIDNQVQDTTVLNRVAICEAKQFATIENHQYFNTSYDTYVTNVNNAILLWTNSHNTRYDDILINVTPYSAATTNINIYITIIRYY